MMNLIFWLLWCSLRYHTLLVITCISYLFLSLYELCVQLVCLCKWAACSALWFLLQPVTWPPVAPLLVHWEETSTQHIRYKRETWRFIWLKPTSNKSKTSKSWSYFEKVNLQCVKTYLLCFHSILVSFTAFLSLSYSVHYNCMQTDYYAKWWWNPLATDNSYFPYWRAGNTALGACGLCWLWYSGLLYNMYAWFLCCVVVACGGYWFFVLL